MCYSVKNACSLMAKAGSCDLAGPSSIACSKLSCGIIGAGTARSSVAVIGNCGISEN